MFTLTIGNNLKRRTLGYLTNDYYPGGKKDLGRIVNYKILGDDGEGFFKIGFPGMDRYEFEDVVKKLIQQGVSPKGADSQLTENKIMKLKNLVPLKEDLQVTTNNGKVAIISNPEDVKTFYKGGTVFGETSDGDSIELSKETSIDFHQVTQEGTCGYGREGKIGNKPAGQESDLEKLRAFVRETVKETFQDNPDVQGITGMENAVKDPSAKAEKILNQLAKTFPDIPLERVVNDSTYKRQAIIQILFGMAN